MRNFYDKYWEQIASIQIPHHGSVNNYDPQLYEYPVRGIVSVGNDNIYHHPDIDTLVKIQSEGCRPVIVTEDISSMKIYQYEIDWTCGLAPVCLVDGKVYGRLAPANVKNIVQEYREMEK